MNEHRSYYNNLHAGACVFEECTEKCFHYDPPPLSLAHSNSHSFSLSSTKCVSLFTVRRPCVRRKWCNRRFTIDGTHVGSVHAYGHKKTPLNC